MSEISGPAMRELEPSARKSRSPYTADRGAGIPKRGLAAVRKPPERVLVMAFRVSIAAPMEMSEASLECMMARANRVKESLAIAGYDVLHGFDSIAVDVEEVY